MSPCQNPTISSMLLVFILTIDLLVSKQFIMTQSRTNRPSAVEEAEMMFVKEWLFHVRSLQFHVKEVHFNIFTV